LKQEAPPSIRWGSSYVDPAEEGEKILDENLNLNNLMPKDKRYKTYSGSLTTLPCTEGVRCVLKNYFYI
jgi:carbonic anhydrase